MNNEQQEDYEQALRIAYEEASYYREVAYRRGWQHGATEMQLIILHLVRKGYSEKEITQLLAVYHDCYVTQWRCDGNLAKREAFPVFDVVQLEAKQREKKT